MYNFESGPFPINVYDHDQLCMYFTGTVSNLNTMYTNM